MASGRIAATIAAESGDKSSREMTMPRRQLCKRQTTAVGPVGRPFAEMITRTPGVRLPYR
jgi:hypothetical protein